MIEFLKKLFGQSGSSATAKERLRLVLMTDHLELAPEMIEAMKRDLVDVISRHVEVDRDKIEVNFERQDSALAMLANIPILSVNRPTPASRLVPVEKRTTACSQPTARRPTPRRLGYASAASARRKRQPARTPPLRRPPQLPPPRTKRFALSPRKL